MLAWSLGPHGGGRVAYFARVWYKHGDVLERVEVFKYLGCLLAQDNDDIQAVRQQIRKARGTWVRAGQVLGGENAEPHVAAKFDKAVVQSVLFYGS